METPHTDPNPAQWDPGLYTRAHSFVWQAAHSLVDLLNPQPGERIMDLGCGTGQLTRTLADSGATVVGVDRSPEMIEAAKAAYPGLDLRVMDALHLTSDEPLDAVFSNAALHWIPRADVVARNIVNILRPGGRFVAEFGGKGNIRTILAGLREAIHTETGRMVMNPWYFPTIAEYAAVLERAGLEVTFAQLFDRPTPGEGPDAMRNWLRMFCGTMLDAIPGEKREAVISRCEDNCRPSLFRDGVWVADYRRLRVMAIKPS
jgi:trans-aconitate 2-methyltransferase